MERSESMEKADGKVKMDLQGDMVAGKAGTIWECIAMSQKRAVTIHLGNQLHQKYPVGNFGELMLIQTGNVGTIRPEAYEKLSVVLYVLSIQTWR